MIYSVAVIGAGNIAGGYDEPGSRHILTHLHAVTSSPRLACAGLYDLDREKAQQQASKWGVTAAPALERLFAAPVDIAVVAVPDDAHEHYLRDLLDRDVRIVLCEKPLTVSLAASREIVQAYERAGRTLLVNYQRRFEPSVVELKRRLGANELGRPVAGVVWYSKGVLHNGSHAVDLLRFLFGEVRAASARSRIVDHVAADPTVGGTLVFADVAIELVAGDERLFSLFEIDLLFEKARYRYLQSGTRLECYEARPDPLYPGYTEMLRVAESATGLDRALPGCYSALIDHLDGARSFPHLARDTLGTQQVCEILQTLPLHATWSPSQS